MSSAVLQTWADRIRELETLGERSLSRVARVVEIEAKRTAAAGLDPEGRPWPRTKRGARALPNADKAIAVRAIGRSIAMRLSGPEARHHLGRVRGGVRRQILPTVRIPPRMDAAIREVVRDEFRRTVRGRR